MAMIDFRALSHFLVACEHGNLGSASRELEIGPSTLSASLKSLEAGFGASLFRKHGAGLSPRRLAHWLYRATIPILLVEAFARRRVTRSPAEPVFLINVEVRLRFAFGQFRRALANAIAQTATEEPLVLIDPQWPMEPGAAFGVAKLDVLGFAEIADLLVEVVSRPADVEAGEVVLREDPWMMVRRRFGNDGNPVAEDFSRQNLFVPALPQVLIDQIVAYAEERKAVVTIVETQPDDWPQMLENHPGGAILLPASAIAARLGAPRVEATPLCPAISSTIVGRPDGGPLAARFLQRLKAAFDTAEPSVAFSPVLTARRIRYFNYAYELGRVSAAARAAGVAQPAMSQQLHKLEESLGISLFDRRTFGLIRTSTSTQFAVASDLLDKRLRELEISGATALLAESGRLSLGVLPSVSHHSHLVNRITDAVLALQEQYPAMRLTIREAPNGTLQNMVMRGGLALAIVETIPSQMPRLPLDASEALSVIVDPAHDLLPSGPVRLADLARVPLALPTPLFGLRQVVDAAARDIGLELRPDHEIDALTMLITLLTRKPIATILPASAVRPELLRGELTAHEITDPSIMRRLYVIYSGDRSLTSAERDLVKLLKLNLAIPDYTPV